MILMSQRTFVVRGGSGRIQEPLSLSIRAPITARVSVGADVEVKEGTGGFTALMAAAALGTQEAVRLLVDNGR